MIYLMHLWKHPLRHSRSSVIILNHGILGPISMVMRECGARQQQHERREYETGCCNLDVLGVQMTLTIPIL